MKDLKCSPNVVTYSILINGLCRVRKFNKAFLSWQEMKNFSHPLNIIMYTTMIYSLARSRNIVEAYDLFGKLKARGHKFACYNALITRTSNANKPWKHQIF